MTGRNKDQDRIYQDEEGRLVVQDVQQKDEGVVSCILFTGSHELIANSALKIGILEYKLSMVSDIENSSAFTFRSQLDDTKLIRDHLSHQIQFQRQSLVQKQT